MLKAAGAHPAPRSRETADSARETSGGGSGGAPAKQNGEPVQNGHSHAADDRSTAAESDCDLPPAQQGQVHDEAAAAAQRWLLRYCQVAVISLGPRGCMAQDRLGSTAACAADRCNPALSCYTCACRCVQCDATKMSAMCQRDSRQFLLSVWLTGATAAESAGWMCRTLWGRATASRRGGWPATWRGRRWQRALLPAARRGLQRCRRWAASRTTRRRRRCGSASRRCCNNAVWTVQSAACPLVGRGCRHAS